MSSEFATEQRSERAREQLKALARRIRALREQQGLTQEAFASRCGISVSFASLLERGERSPSYETLLVIAEALGVSLAELFRDPGESSYDDPYFGKLLELARTHHLSRSQVDRWLAVGQAMFEGSGEDRDKGTRRRRAVSGSCEQVGCNRPVLAKGLCASHYHRARRARL